MLGFSWDRATDPWQIDLLIFLGVLVFPKHRCTSACRSRRPCKEEALRARESILRAPLSAGLLQAPACRAPTRSWLRPQEFGECAGGGAGGRVRADSCPGAPGAVGDARPAQGWGACARAGGCLLAPAPSRLLSGKWSLEGRPELPRMESGDSGQPQSWW